MYNWADVIKTHYNTCLSHPTLTIMVQWRKEMFIWQKNNTVHLKIGISNSAFVLNLSYIFCHSTS